MGEANELALKESYCSERTSLENEQVFLRLYITAHSFDRGHYFNKGELAVLQIKCSGFEQSSRICDKLLYFGRHMVQRVIHMVNLTLVLSSYSVQYNKESFGIHVGRFYRYLSEATRISVQFSLHCESHGGGRLTYQSIARRRTIH